MAVPFDHIAPTFGSVLTKRAIGQLQRKLVWNHIEKITGQLEGLEMLEIDPGSGDDAIMFSEKGFNLIATDLSAEMFKVTKQNGHHFSMQHGVSSHYMDLDAMSETLFDKKFDLVFSNFGALNCIQPSSLKKFFDNLPSILNPKGRFIAVVMPKFCWWEAAFFLSKLKFKKIFHRWTDEEVLLQVEGAVTRNWFYHPSEVKKLAHQHFKTICTKPVGLALPPVHFEKFFIKKQRLLMRLNNIEKKLNRLSLYPGMADHFIIDLQLK
jgi:ubiquinone/menaquinone biosynthesis C-methylase UbiE